jgi:hypothetical protein
VPPLLRQIGPDVPGFLFRAAVIDVLIAGDSMEPGRERTLPSIGIQRGPEGGEGFLRQILGVGGAFGQASEVAEYFFVKEPE